MKNNRGKLTLKAVKDRQAATSDPNERETLARYLEADRERKAATKEASELLANLEKQYQKQLKADALPENLVDLHTTVRYLGLLAEQSAIKSRVKEVDAALDKLAYDKYPQLSVDEIKTVAVDDKWLAMIGIAVHG